MCGIVGACGISHPQNIIPETLQGMLGLIRHRGPDGCGLYIDGSAGLGHARLSIIDIEGGAQPICNEDNSLWIVFNGEIFNYPELKGDLLKLGHRFYTNTDTEVILHLFEDRGVSCLDCLNGQFAFAIWNSVKKELFLARDRAGILPLYYTVHNGSIIFASEIKSIFAYPGIEREIEPKALDQISSFWTTLPGITPFKGIKELPAGHFLLTSNGNLSLKKYWDFNFRSSSEVSNPDSEQICSKVSELLLDAVRIRLRADVPVGCYLSGGLDSSGITSMVKKNFNNDLKTFGIRFEENAFDERDYQDEMVAYLNTDHKIIEATNKLIADNFESAIWHCEKPLLRTAPVPLYMLSDLVSQNNFKVVLTGEGADEIFGGYNIFKEAKVRDFWARRPDSVLRPKLINRLYPYILNDPKLQNTLQAFFSQGMDDPGEAFFSHRIRWQNTGKIKIFLSGDYSNESCSFDSYEELRMMLPENFYGWDILSRAQYLEMKLFLSNYLLSSQGDRMAMAHGVEMRLPYLDHRLIDYMGSITSALKIRGFQEKFLLKKVYRNILPDRILHRAKHPYRAPIKGSLLSADSSWRRDMLSESSLKVSGIFVPERVSKLLKKLEATSKPGETDSMALTGILSTESLYRQFITNFRAKPGTQKIGLLFDRRETSQK